MTNHDTHFMTAALVEARLAGAAGEVPIGAVAVRDGQIIGRAGNIREATHNPLGHAEVLLIQSIASQQSSWRLDDVTIYVTCEPCIMCAGAMLQARVTRVVYGCADSKAGACDSLYQLLNDPRLNHRIPVTSGVLAAECGALLSDFFRKLRQGEKV